MKRFLYAALLALFVLPAGAQTPIPPINQPVFRAFDSNGVPLAGGLLYSYAAGTSTPLSTYTDAAGTAPNTNPVVLDATGQAKVFMGVGTYKFVLQNSLGVQQWTVDQISGAVAAGITSFNGRSGAVVPASGDYDCAMVTNCPAALTFSAAFIDASNSIDLANVGTAGTYATPSSITTDAYGRVTAVTAGTGGGGTPRTCTTGTTWTCYRITADGTIDEWGVAGPAPTGAENSTVVVTFPHAFTSTADVAFTAWPNNCGDSSPCTAEGSKTPVSINGAADLTTTTVSVQVYTVAPVGGGGAGGINNTIYIHWHATGS